MSQTTQIVLGLVFVVGAFVLSQVIVAGRLRRAAGRIVADLQRQGATDPFSAVALDYAKPHLLRVGLRDMRPRALADLIQGDIVGKTAAGTFFLKRQPTPPGGGDTDGLPATGRR